MITDPEAAASFDKLLMSDLAEEVDNAEPVPDNKPEVESHSADAGPDKSAEEADDASPEQSGEQAEDAGSEAPGEPVDADEERFADKREAYQAWKEVERELGRRVNELTSAQSRLQRLEAELSEQNRQLQEVRLPADISQLTPEAYEAHAAEAQRLGFPTVEDYVADQRLNNKVQSALQAELGGVRRGIAYDQARTFSGTLPDMDKVGPRVAAILEESGAIDLVPAYLDASAQAEQMKAAIKTAHLQAHNEYLQAELPKIRRAEAQRLQREAAARKAGKQSSTVAGTQAAVPSPGASTERSPAEALLGNSSAWWKNIKH